ncbi:MAG: hypothetical protein ACYDCL_08990 [Myxococcales bacterium]
MTELMAHLLLFLFGAAIGTALDHLHVWGGVLGYPHVAFWGEAAFVPPLFGAAAVALVCSWRFGFRGDEPRWHGAWPALPYLALFSAAYAASVALQRQPLAALALMVGAWFPFAMRLGPRLVIYALLSAAAGCLVESALSWAGLFHYYAPGQLGLLPVPLWLPGLYLHASLATRAVDLAFFAPRIRAAAVPA